MSLFPENGRQRIQTQERKKRQIGLKRAPSTARQKADDVLDLWKQGVGVTEIARKLGIGRASVYRILRDKKAV